MDRGWGGTGAGKIVEVRSDLEILEQAVRSWTLHDSGVPLDATGKL